MAQDYFYSACGRFTSYIINMTNTPKTKEGIASSLMEDIECDDTKCPYTKTDGLHFHMERLEEKVVEALTAYRQSVLEEGDCEHDIGSRNDFGCIACGASTDEL